MAHIVYPETGSPLPAPDFFFVRHCESEVNTFFERVYSRDHETRERAYARLNARPPEHWDRQSPLTQNGCAQARATGAWLKSYEEDRASQRQSRTPISIRRSLAPFYDCTLVSPFRRPMETAACFGLSQQAFEPEPLLVEQSFGERAYLGPILLQERYPEEYEAWQRDPFRHRPPGGESLDDMVNGRVRKVIQKIDGRHPRRMVIVGHSEAFRAFQYRFEGMTPETFRIAYFDPANALGYGEIMHYSQINPRTRKLDADGLWVRKISPKINPAETIVTGWREICLPRSPLIPGRRRSCPPSDPPEAREPAP